MQGAVSVLHSLLWVGRGHRPSGALAPIPAVRGAAIDPLKSIQPSLDLTPSGAGTRSFAHRSGAAVRGGSKPPLTEHQIQDQDEEQKTADTDTAAVSVTRISEAAASQQEDDQHNQDDRSHNFMSPLGQPRCRRLSR